MKLVAQLEELLYQAEVKPTDEDLRLQGWRILIHESQAISLGIKDNMPGSVYTPPGYRMGESGEVFLVWADGRLSQVKVQAHPAGSAIWPEQLREWRAAAYDDPEGALIPAPEPLPLVAVEDRTIQKIIAGDDQILFDQLARLLAEKPADVKLQGSIQAVWGYRHVRTSTGLAVTYQESQYLLSYAFDGLVWAGLGKRRLVQPDEWDGLWQRTVGYREALRREAPPVGTDTMVILAASVVEQMMEQYILPNFAGQNVLEGNSAFTIEGFQAGEQVFGGGVSLLIDAMRPLEWGSYLVTAEGVPARKTKLVHEGKLKTPFLRVKDARRWGDQPTALPQGTAGLYLSQAHEELWPAALADVDDGILILSVLGLHTQDSVSGKYSLSAPQSLRILHGEIVGCTNVKLDGSFFADLAASATRFARSKLAAQPYLIVRTGVQSL